MKSDHIQGRKNGTKKREGKDVNSEILRNLREHLLGPLRRGISPLPVEFRAVSNKEKLE